MRLEDCKDCRNRQSRVRAPAWEWRKYEWFGDFRALKPFDQGRIRVEEAGLAIPLEIVAKTLDFWMGLCTSWPVLAPDWILHLATPNPKSLEARGRLSSSPV